jgi:hypothetical protein
MNPFNELTKLYLDIDNQYASLEFDAHSKGNIRKERDYQRKRYLNDQAYFLFIFTRLEKRIRDLSDNLINLKNTNNASYKNKNAWRLIKKGQTNLMDRVSFFQLPGGQTYTKIYDYKKDRDKVAHGNIASGINIPTILSEMKQLYHDLNT